MIEESEWKDSETIENFVEINPGVNNLPALARTKVRVTYDRKNLYIAFNAYDNPKLIILYFSPQSFYELLE